MHLNIEKKAQLAATIMGIAVSLGFTPSAHAGCGNAGGSIGSFNAGLLSPAAATKATAEAQTLTANDSAQPGGSDVVGMWAITFTAKNNPGGPPDGVVLDAGFSQWHSDGTEIMNSSKPPATGNFCLGVWKKVGSSTYRLTHKVLDYTPAGILNGPGTIREEVTVDRTGNRFSGIFSIDLYDTAGNLIVHLNGELTGVRVTVD